MCKLYTFGQSLTAFSLLWNPRKSIFTKCTIHSTQIFGIIHCKQCWLWCWWLSCAGLFCLADKHVVSLPHTEKPHCGAWKGKLESFKVSVKEIGYVNVAKSRDRGEVQAMGDLCLIFCLPVCVHVTAIFVWTLFHFSPTFWLVRTCCVVLKGFWRLWFRLNAG